MFSLVRLQNFKNFQDVTLDLETTNGKPKHMVIIYGPNGSGKSTLISAFRMLVERLVFLAAVHKVEELREMRMENHTAKALLNDIEDTVDRLRANMKKYRSLGCSKPMVAEFHFILKGRKGCYIIKEDETGIIYECLDFEVVKQRGRCFELSKNAKILNRKVFSGGELRKRLMTSIHNHWGSNSLLGILFDELRNGNLDGYQDDIGNSIYEVLDFMASMIGQTEYRIDEEVEIPQGTIPFSFSGTIAVDNEKMLDEAADIMSHFLPCVNENIKSAYYRKYYRKDLVEFILYLKERINGITVDVPWHWESTGTVQAINVLSAFQLLLRGQVVILDEFESNLHESVMSKIMEEASPYLKGQLICTTHMTKIMESAIDRKAFYTIERRRDREEINCISDYRVSLGQRSNIRSRYFKDSYGGLPNDDDLNLGLLKNMFNEACEKLKIRFVD